MDKSVQNYVTDGLRLLGQLWTPGGGPSPENLVEGCTFLNQLLDSWNTMRNALYSVSDLTFTLTSGKYIYTMGPGGDFNGPRPQKIQRIDLIYETMPQLLRLPIDLIDVDEWAGIRVPNLPNAVPFKCYCDYGYSQSNPTGLATLYFWPGPMSGFGIEMWIWNALNSALGLADTLYAPPGYARALTYGLAADMMPLYPKRVTPMREAQIMRTAEEARAWVMSLNAPNPQTPMPSGILGNRNRSNFNWLASTN